MLLNVRNHITDAQTILFGGKESSMRQESYLILFSNQNNNVTFDVKYHVNLDNLTGFALNAFWSKLSSLHILSMVNRSRKILFGDINFIPLCGFVS